MGTATINTANNVIPQGNVIPEAQIIPPPPPPMMMQQQQHQNSYNALFSPSHISSAPQNEIPKEMMTEEPVSEWVPPTPTESDHDQMKDVEVFIECAPELPQVSLPATSGFHSVVSLSASSQAVVDDENVNSSVSPPMDIVCVLDVSGSMGSDNKLNNLKCAVNFMRDELKDQDRMSVITFERSSNLIHGLKKMTADNKSSTASYINRLRPGGGTRILSGLQKAHSVLQNRETKNPISSVFLLTDGIDSSDLRDKKRIAKEIKDMGASLFVYGFGNDHDSIHLKTIADAGEGSFTFIEKSDMVIDAFGGALGAEKSIFAQNLCLTITAASGAIIKNVHSGNYRKTLEPSGASVNVYFPNLMQGEQRDILLMMDLPAASEPVENQCILTSRIQYSPIIRTNDSSGDNVVGKAGQECNVSRVSQVDTNLERDNNVDVQINRALLDRATAASVALADQGNFKKARTDLQATVEAIKSSSSGRRKDEKTISFVSELESTIDNFQDDVYRFGGGRSMMTEMQSNINAQRCTYSKAGRSQAYQNDASVGFQAKTNRKKAAFFGK